MIALRCILHALVATVIYAIGAVAVFRAYPVLVDADATAAPVLAGLFFVVVGVAAGGASRAIRASRLLALLVAAVLSAVLCFLGFYLPRMLPLFEISLLERTHVIAWALATFVGYVSISLGKGRPDVVEESIPLDDVVRDYATQKGLLLSKNEVARLRARPGGLVCLCRADYSDETDDWLHQWMRCRANPEHIYHAWHFKDNEWRCPLCRHPVLSLGGKR